MQYCSAEKWSWSLENILERTTEITAWTLFLISNKWMIRYANTIWLHPLFLFLMVYQAWIYKQLFSSESKNPQASRKSQAS